ncbi:TonB-dependent receptor [Pseudaminobacter arsenicus]|uniref:TonB-dependent receptor n=1 Tax=Borborobacter arsenicus TaxID=1851146 RepID=A0A432V8P1_9HYPH|nr:TonB-dependent receptor [Pseudaminobacter arsenicus]RUM98552.1 TonB-dependent receptor [Pseudaminobacter arsenicus]
MTTGVLRAGIVALAAGAAALLISLAPASAQESDDATIQLNQITVTTPLRRESALARSTSSVTVIGEQEIEKSAAADLPSLLKTYAGVSVRTNGGFGADSSVSLRGTSPRQTLVLINGVRASSATLGTTAISAIPLASIERIEIAKGGHSAQYGADAIGGIINIITRQGGACDNGNAACGTLTAGVMHPWGGYVSGNVGGRTADGVDYSLGGSLFGTRGYDFTTRSDELDEDGFRQGSLNFALSKEFDWGRLYADGLYARGRNQYDQRPPAPNESDTDNFAGKIGARVDHSESWSSTLELTSSVDKSINFRGDVQGDIFDTLRYGIFASTQKTFETEKARHVVTGGVEAYRESVDGSSVFGLPYDVTDRDLAAVFGQYSFEYEVLTVDTGLRYDHNDQFGGATTYNIGASYEFVPGLVARSSFATGFRAPTFNELYYPFMGNPNLLPEESRSYEVGLNWQPTEATSLDLALYRTLIRNQINWGEVRPEVWLPSNIERAMITGFEATLGHRFNDSLSGRASIDIRDPKNRTSGFDIPYQYRFKAAAELEFQATEELALGAAVVYTGSRFTNDFNTVKLPAYTTVDLRASYAFDERSELKLAVENVFDEQYSTSNGFRSPGRTFNLSFSRSF